MNYKISIIAVILILALVFFLKPDASSTEISDQQDVSTTSQPAKATPLDSSLNQSVSSASASSEENLQGSQEEELFDTKSDFSIQPIDPATDPGNQLPEDHLPPQ